MKFKCYAGNMFVGYLVTLRGLQCFTNRDNKRLFSQTTIDRVRGYRQLKLIKV